MRRLRYAVATSLDGYIAGPQGEADWIVSDSEIDFGARFGQFDTLLMGRRTYTAAAVKGGGEVFAGMRVLVASRTLAPREHPTVTVVGDDLAATVRALKAEPGKDIWLFGGGELCRSLLELGMVDTVEVAVIPVLLGRGVPLLPSLAARTGLSLRHHRVYENTGIVELHYDVEKPRRRRARRG